MHIVNEQDFLLTFKYFSIMVRNRVLSFPRQIIVCLSLSLIAILFVLSCQKDDGLKQKDPNALTKAQAKEYFEQTATTLKFLTTGITPAETKNADYSLTENMVIEWDQALEGETSTSFFVEIPIIVTHLRAMIYDGIGNLNTNVREVPINTSLLIEKYKDNGSLHSFIVTVVGYYTSTPNDVKYGFLCNKNNFTGFQIFSREDGYYYSSHFFDKGKKKIYTLKPEGSIQRIDSTGRDLCFKGVSFLSSSNFSTKGGGGLSSGESYECPNCHIPLASVSDHYYYCVNCGMSIGGMIGLEICPVCLFPYMYNNYYENGNGTCMCCPNCHQYPCICGEGDALCPFCWSYGCAGACMQGNNGGGSNGENGNNGNSGTFIHLVGAVDSLTLYGHVEQQPWGEYYNYGTQVSLMAYPNTGFRFAGWKKDGVLVSNDNPLLVYAYQDMTFYALFTEEDY